MSETCGAKRRPQETDDAHNGEEHSCILPAPHPTNHLCDCSYDWQQGVENVKLDRVSVDGTIATGEGTPIASAAPKEEPATSLGHMPEGEKWKFDAGVADVFDDMISRSIPEYTTMRKLVFSLGAKFVKNGTDIVDLGAARGEALVPFVARFGAYNRYMPVEVSAPMREAIVKRFEGFILNKLMTVYLDDLRTSYPPARASLTLSIFTMQFVPIEYRQALAKRIFDHTLPGGALVLVEKVIGGDAVFDDLFVERYLVMKAEHGYSKDEIDRKRFALEGVLVPVTARWNEEILRNAGFERVECFWRWCNFCGWIAIKGEAR